MNLFNTSNKQYKGNLHTHTTLSDGLKSVEECIELYKQNGYDFISITDHRKYFGGCTRDDFLVFSGTEFHVHDYETKRAYHIVGIGIKNEIYTDDSFTPQRIIDEINAAKGMAIIAHPTWSLLTHRDLMDLHSYVGIEIWNKVSESYSNRGDSTYYVDVLASKGKTPLVFAVDDTHFYEDDLFGGFIMVNSESLNKDDIMESIKNKKFYCSQGPEIYQIELEDDVIKVETSPVKQISFMSDTFYCSDRIFKKAGELITGGVYNIKKTDSFVRIECIDQNNKKAWSQVISLN